MSFGYSDKDCSRYGDRFRSYGEALDARSHGENFFPRGIEVNRWDGENLFADVKLWDGQRGKFWVRGGVRHGGIGPILFGTVFAMPTPHRVYSLER